MEISLEPFDPEAMPQRLAVHRAFDVRQVRVADAVIVEVIGEIDMSTAPKLAGAVASVHETTRRVVVDLSEVSFLDSSALSALVLCERELVEQAPSATPLRWRTRAIATAPLIVKAGIILEVGSCWGRIQPVS